MLNELCKEAHENAVAHGWWEGKKSFGELIALCHSELSEALEEYRAGEHWNIIYYSDKQGAKYGCDDPFEPLKPEGIPIELADVLIRIFDMCGYYGIDLDEAVRIKMNYNKTRPYRHGGKKL